MHKSKAPMNTGSTILRKINGAGNILDNRITL